MKHLLTNMYYLDQPDNISHLLNVFSEQEQSSNIQMPLLSSSMGSSHELLHSLQNLLQKKFTEWSTKLENEQKQYPVMDKNQFENKVKQFSRLMDNIFMLFTSTMDQDDRLEKNFADLVELLMKDTTKFDDIPELSPDDLKILGDFETILPSKDWNEVMDDACDLIGDPDIMNDVLAQLSVDNCNQTGPDKHVDDEKNVATP